MEQPIKSVIFYLNQDIFPALGPPDTETNLSLLTTDMNQAHPIINSAPADPPSVPDPDQETVTIGAAFLNWLAHFTLYLGTVAVVCALGFYFFSQLPLPQDLSQLLKNAGDLSPPRPATAASSPSILVKSPAVAIQPPANPVPTPPSSTPEVAAVTAPTTVSPNTDSDPNAPPQVIESPVAEPPADAQALPADAQALPVEEPPVPKPQTEIEQRLAEAQQQMDSRRLTAPASNNALRSYQRVLELEPGNTVAQAGIDRIAAYYRDVAAESLRQGRPDESLAYVGRGLRAMPQNPDLLNLRRQARLLQQKREQAQQEEMRRQQEERELAEQRYEERLRQQQRMQESPNWWQQAPRRADDNDNSTGFNQR